MLCFLNWPVKVYFREFEVDLEKEGLNADDKGANNGHGHTDSRNELVGAGGQQVEMAAFEPSPYQEMEEGKEGEQN